MNEQFGNRLMDLRRQRGLSQEDLGNLIGVSRQTISKWELNLTTPELEKLIALGSVFAMSIDELIGNEAVHKEVGRTRFHYEYRSKKMIGKRPLVHINLGCGLYKANGIFSIGMVSTGIVSLGVFSCGILSMGAVSLGIISIAALALGLLSLGSVAIGLIALGAISLGYFSLGALAVGVYAKGAAAFGLHIAFGDYARGHIAIGRTTAIGTYQFLLNNSMKCIAPEEVKSAILREYPAIANWLLTWFTL